MIQDKRGLSAIITTLLVVLLVLVAVGIVWGVVSGVLRGGAEDLEFSAKCLNIDVRATAVNCVDTDEPVDGEMDECIVVLDRTGTEDEAIAGVKLVFRNSTNPSSVIDVEGNIEALVGATPTATGVALTAPDSVEVTAYFVDASGNDKNCATTTKDF